MPVALDKGIQRGLHEHRAGSQRVTCYGQLHACVSLVA